MPQQTHTTTDDQAFGLSVARSHAEQIAAARRMTTNQLLKQARHVALARRKLGSPELFQRWLVEIGIRPGQAELLLRVCSLFGECDGAEQIDAGAMVLLAKPDSPSPAVSHAVYLAKRGELVTADRARELIARHTRPQQAAAPDTAGDAA